MSMLASFFDIRKDSTKLFQGLNIFKEQRLCNDWMNQYPTLFLSFKDVDGTMELKIPNKEIKEIFETTVKNGFYDYKEDFYHAFLAGIFAGAGYI